MSEGGVCLRGRVSCINYVTIGFLVSHTAAMHSMFYVNMNEYVAADIV